MHQRLPTCRGMTLPELLVVVAIIGLLAVAVLPALGGSSRRSQTREAADLLVSHISHVSAKAIGSRYGASTWLETESTGAGGDQSVVKLGFGRIRAAISGSGTLTPAGSGTATLNVANSSSLLALAPCLPAPIEFVGSPNLLLATNLLATGTQISVTSIELSLNRTAANSAIPASPNAAIPYVLHVPPRPRLTASARYIPNNMAIDFAWSSIGVPGFTQPASRIVSAAGSATGPRCIAITFDRTGRPNRAWYSLGHPDIGASPPTWNFVTLDAGMPVALLVGPRGNVGNAYVASPTDDNPGANWQNPDARWVLIDPRAAIVKSIETYSRATSRDDSLRFVVQTLKNQAAQ